ncbi:MAG TPA: DnaJ domain-containing protein [Oligoflexia bacterium]|nr:DnaJ domain-containing protein [Oligoflexia bacterium]HMR24805.1 DnaJ domain-containing protein [Oligoflexia bacterium]
MGNKTGHNAKVLKKNDFLEFFAFIEKRVVSSNIVLVSDEKKSVLVLRQGKIVAHKSNVPREHLLDQIIKNIDPKILLSIKSSLEKLAPFDQWAYLYNKKFIEKASYQTLLNNDCSKIFVEHYHSKQTILLKMPQIKSIPEHAIHISPFYTVFEALKQDFKPTYALEQCKRININVKNQNVFDLYLKNLRQQQVTYDDVNNTYIAEKPNSELIKDLLFLKEQNIIELGIITEKHQQQDIIFNEKELLGKNAFEVLGLDETANGALIKKKYMEMVAVYHPDKNGHLPENEKKNIENIFSKITLAYKKISTSELRKEYIKELSNIRKTNKNSEEAQKQVQAETLFLEGLAYMKSKNFNKAHEMFKESDSILPNEKYRVYAAWSQYKLGEENYSRSMIEQARENLKKEILKDMPMLEALFYLGSVEKSLGNYKQAKIYFEQVVNRDPYFMNAKVELSLVNKRV